MKIVKKEFIKGDRSDEIVGYIDIVELDGTINKEDILAKVILQKNGNIGTLYYKGRAMTNEYVTDLIKTSREELEKVSKEIN